MKYINHPETIKQIKEIRLIINLTEIINIKDIQIFTIKYLFPIGLNNLRVQILIQKCQTIMKLVYLRKQIPKKIIKLHSNQVIVILSMI